MIPAIFSAGYNAAKNKNRPPHQVGFYFYN